MRPAPGMHVEWVDEEAVVLDEASGELHYLNPTAALVYGLILEHGFEEGMRVVASTHTSSPEAREELDLLVEHMTELGLLVE